MKILVSVAKIFSLISFLMFLAIEGGIASHKPYDKALSDRIEGVGKATRFDAKEEWWRACRAWKKRAQGGSVLNADCGEPLCEEAEHEWVCGSSGRKTVRFYPD